MITYIIIGITILASILAFQDRAIFSKYLFNPFVINEQKQVYRFLTHAFIHADWMHLIMNMLVLYSFGQTLETVYFPAVFELPKASMYYVFLYLLAILVSALPSFEKNKHNSYYSSVGASGAVSAVVFSCILIDPTQKIIFLFLPFPIPAVVFGLLYLVYSWYMSKKGTDNIGHDAHFWGAVFGFVYTLLLKPSLFLSFVYQTKQLF
ncbi:MAG: rhomboid family intramembrane serine protease [Bacteroidetes bacterium]|nr:rhomboid family intramembrane serine protease [Bacteroidota bacterium]